ncbi:proton-conducting transporter membrane subunit [Streptomyces morookaense]|uniref:proton-conducting transporter transmembrane domain-containing protein n=1 Tax=Streptomyces morookaense TaxID=1970 RepID=UPI0033EABC4C
MTPLASQVWLAVPVAVPLAAAGVHTAFRRRALSAWTGLLSPCAVLAAGVVLARAVLSGGHPPTAFRGVLRADALSVWILLVVGAVAALAAAAAPAHLAGERAAGRADAATARRYQVLVHAFLGAMCAAVLAANLGVLWVAIEATTIVTAFLVGHRRTRASVEAAWKYVVICSAGIALAFLGIVLLYYAARAAQIPEAQALDWPVLVAHADRLDPAVTRLATALVVLGFGAKAGLVPLHAWLPDAHSQAPAPVSALMSGVLLSVSFTAVLRCKAVADLVLGPGYTRTLLTATALLTLALAVALLLAQRDYKRMLAYSSMEHMSLIALGAAVGTPLAMSAALLHIAGHGLAKTVAFCASGHVLQLRGTTRIGRVRGLLARAPGLGTAFGLSVLALLALPPSGLFASELALARAAFAARFGWAAAAVLLLVLTAFAALAVRTAAMLLGGVPRVGAGPAASGAGVALQLQPAEQRLGVPPVVAEGTPQGPCRPAGDRPGPARLAPGTPAVPVRLGMAAGLPLVLGLAACAALGVAAGPLTDLLSAAALPGRP